MTTFAKIAAIALMLAFYTAYFAKAIMLRKKGTQTMILGEGDKPAEVGKHEKKMKMLTFIIPFVELLSIMVNIVDAPSYAKMSGLAIALVGVLFFVSATRAMKDSWRAGIPGKKETELVTSGIYQYSRNPAFVGFDLMYIGLAISFPNAWHIIFVVGALFVFHIQILNEEAFMEKAFGQEYVDYKSKVRRYI